MKPPIGITLRRKSTGANSASIRTTLYDLIQSIGDRVPPEREDLVTRVMVHLLISGRVKFLGNPELMGL
jgi:hypothetical protein